MGGLGFPKMGVGFWMGGAGVSGGHVFFHGGVDFAMSKGGPVEVVFRLMRSDIAGRGDFWVRWFVFMGYGRETKVVVRFQEGGNVVGKLWYVSVVRTLVGVDPCGGWMV